MARSWWVVTPTICLVTLDGYHAQRVAVAVSNKLTPMIIEETLVNEHIMRRRIRHSLGVIPWSLYMLRLRRVISL